MKISAIVCTRNRAAYLPEAVRSLARQNVPAEDYEIIVVDNGSTDRTNEIVTGLMTEVPNLQYFLEKNPGLSNARNRGLTEARAPIVAFLDDDAIADECWLAAILSGFNARPTAACVGGPVQPWWEKPRPRWFPENLLGCHNRNYGGKPRPYNYPAEQPIGCNMAFRKDQLAKVGGFNAQLRKYNDETELIARLVESGGEIFYEPGASVRHLFGKERLTLAWQIRRHYEEGKSVADLAMLNGYPARTQRIEQVGRNLLTIAKRSAQLVVNRSSLPERVQRLTDLSMLVGKTVGLTASLGKS